MRGTNPFPCLLIPKPVFDQIEYVGLGILTTRDLNLVRDIPETLLESGFVARMDPENPRCQ